MATGRFQAAAGDYLNTKAITADIVDASAGGTAAIDGVWNVGSTTLVSNDIDITTNGAIRGGEIALVSSNATQTLIGDGLTGTGYQLSDAEFDRLQFALLQIGADTSQGAADEVLIGDLSYTRPDQQQAVEIDFLTGASDGEIASGSIRVTGEATFSNLDEDSVVYFGTDTFELDAATGSLSLYGAGTELGGTLILEADRVWVASGDILTKLEADPLYVGRVAELNAPAAVQRPDGVLRAGTIELGDEDGLTSLLVQNTGTAAIPAGFLVNFASIAVQSSEALDVPPGSIDLAINGQIVTPTGTITGIAVRDLLVSEFGTEAFLPGSTINGCLLTGSCGSSPIRVDTITRTDVQINDLTGLGDGLFGNEPDIDDNESGDEGDLSSPIEAPNPLFDSRPLTADGDVDDPISGAGNPSLMGTSEDEVQACDPNNEKDCKSTTKGDGK